MGMFFGNGYTYNDPYEYGENDGFSEKERHHYWFNDRRKSNTNNKKKREENKHD